VVVKSNCGLFYGGCCVPIHLESGEPVRVKEDPAAPVSWGAFCMKEVSVR